METNFKGGEMKKLLILLLIGMCTFIMCKDEKKEPAPEPEVIEKVVFKGTFLEILAKATGIMQAQEAEAELYEADATNIDTVGMTVDNVRGWKFVYYLPNDRTGFITYTDSTFSNVSIVDAPWFEDRMIKNVKMDLVEAIKLMRKANYSDKFVDLCLRWPLYPGNEEPFYIFSCPKIGWIFVGTQSNKVTVEKFK